VLPGVSMRCINLCLYACSFILASVNHTLDPANHAIDIKVPYPST
jgi:hypothetical protein